MKDKPKPKSDQEILKSLRDKGFPEIVQMIPLTAGLTVKLTDVQTKILAVKLYSGTEMLPVREKCILAGICTKSWYIAHHDQRFKDACVEATRAKIAANCPEIYNRYQSLAMSKDSDRRQEKLLIEAGILTAQNTVINQNITINIEEIKKKRIENQRLGFKAFGLALPSDN